MNTNSGIMRKEGTGKNFKKYETEINKNRKEKLIKKFQKVIVQMHVPIGCFHGGENRVSHFNVNFFNSSNSCIGKAAITHSW